MLDVLFARTKMSSTSS